jgi:hypothetical protein
MGYNDVHLGIFRGDWWEPRNPEEFVVAIDQVIRVILHYGIPWVEDRDSKDPNYNSLAPFNIFQETLLEIVAPRLTSYNYERLWCMKAATDAGLRIISSGSSDFVTIGHS